MVESIDGRELDRVVRENDFVIVDFYSSDCLPCEELAPIFERLSDAYKKVKFVKIFRQENRELAVSLGVTGSPTLLFYKNGEPVNTRLSGDINEEMLTNAIENIFQVKRAPAKSETKEYDLAILGSGPAGLTAAVYASRYKINHVLIGELDGGLMGSSHKICNYPSEIAISGTDLTQKMVDHIIDLKVPRLQVGITEVKPSGEHYEIFLTDKRTVKAKYILLATGTKHRHLGVENEENLVGRGISYCATCDAAFFAGKTVAVVGGSDSASTAAIYLAEIADKVYQIYRGSSLRGETAWIDQVKSNPKIELVLNANITKINGEKRLESVIVDSASKKEFKIDGLFVEVGSEPDPKLIKMLELKTDESGYIVTNPDQTTSRPGVWAAGDITTGSNSFRQVITACSEGAIAAQNIFKKIQHK